MLCARTRGHCKQRGQKVEAIPISPCNIDFDSVETCHICEDPFIAGDVKVRDHNHFTGAFRGLAHQECNLNYKIRPIIPIVFHNFFNYNSHFIIKNVATQFTGAISILPINKEKYISVQKFYMHAGNKGLIFRFIDSFRFMDSSLDKLDSYLSEDQFEILRKEFSRLNAHQLKLLSKKGIFPYY